MFKVITETTLFQRVDIASNILEHYESLQSLVAIESYLSWWTSYRGLKNISTSLDANKHLLEKKMNQTICVELSKKIKTASFSFVTSSTHHDKLLKRIVVEQLDIPRLLKTCYEDRLLPFYHNTRSKQIDLETIVRFAKTELFVDDDDDVERYLDKVKLFCNNYRKKNIFSFWPDFWDSIIDAYYEKTKKKLFWIDFYPLKHDVTYFNLGGDKSMIIPLKPFLRMRGEEGEETRISPLKYCPCPFRAFSPLWLNGILLSSSSSSSSSNNNDDDDDDVVVSSYNIFQSSSSLLLPLFRSTITQTLRTMEWYKSNYSSSNFVNDDLSPFKEGDDIIINIILTLNVACDWCLTDENLAAAASSSEDEIVVEITDESFIDLVELVYALLYHHHRKVNDLAAESYVKTVRSALEMKRANYCYTMINKDEEETMYLFLNETTHFRKISSSSSSNWINLASLIEFIFDRSSNISTILSFSTNLKNNAAAATAAGATLTDDAKSLNAYMLYKLYTFYSDGSAAMILDLWKKLGGRKGTTTLNDHIRRTYPTTWSLKRKSEEESGGSSRRCFCYYEEEEEKKEKKKRTPLTIFDTILCCVVFRLDCLICTRVSKSAWRVLYKSSDYFFLLEEEKNRGGDHYPFTVQFPEQLLSHVVSQLQSFEKDFFWMLQPAASSAEEETPLKKKEGRTIIDIIFSSSEEEEGGIEIVNCYHDSRRGGEVQSTLINFTTLKNHSNRYLRVRNREEIYPLLSSIQNVFHQRKKKISDDADSRGGESSSSSSIEETTATDGQVVVGRESEDEEEEEDNNSSNSSRSSSSRGEEEEEEEEETVLETEEEEEEERRTPPPSQPDDLDNIQLLVHLVRNLLLQKNQG